jgi:hypothetical protein
VNFIGQQISAHEIALSEADAARPNAWPIAHAGLNLGCSPYLERGRTHHLASGNGKSHARAMAACWLSLMLLAMKTSASPIVPDVVQPYVQLQQQIHQALRKEHPEWIQPNGDCPTCEAYESRLAELLRLSSQSEHRSAA